MGRMPHNRSRTKLYRKSASMEAKVTFHGGAPIASRFSLFAVFRPKDSEGHGKTFAASAVTRS